VTLAQDDHQTVPGHCRDEGRRGAGPQMECRRGHLVLRSNLLPVARAPQAEARQLLDARAILRARCYLRRDVGRRARCITEAPMSKLSKAPSGRKSN
jgi:hypothetical protein